MSYIVYNKETTRILKLNTQWANCRKNAVAATEGAAKSIITREANKGNIVREDYAYAETSDFYANIEKTEIVKNYMTGKDVEQSVNTPYSCDVSQSRYWSM